MKNLAVVVSLLALGATIISCLLFSAGAVGHDVVKWTALAGTILWFIATPIWMGRELAIDATEVEI